MKEFIFRAVAVVVISLATAAVIRELGKPRKARRWHGKVGGVPYDFRRPTVADVVGAFWNPYDNRLLVPAFFGVGWAFNFRALLEKLGVFEPDVTEEHFLMPTPSIREALAHVTDRE